MYSIFMSINRKYEKDLPNTSTKRKMENFNSIQYIKNQKDTGLVKKGISH